MRGRARWIAGALALVGITSIGAVAGGAVLGDARSLGDEAGWTGATLDRAKKAAEVAQRQVAALDARADHAADPRMRAYWQEQAVAARVVAAEQELTVGRVRSALIATALANQRARLAAQEGPVVRLLAVLASFSRRPALLTLAQPGSLADIVHTQAVLRAVLPAVEARTAALRTQVSRTRALDRNATVAARELAAGRSSLIEARQQLAALRDDADADADGAGDERALALGESAREAVDRLSRIGGEQAALGDLIALPGPPPGQGEAAPASGPADAYRLPVQGRLLTGLGEVSDNGVVSRGLTFAVRPGVAIVAPAGGRIVFARPFRGYGGTVIIDHGDRWTTVITGLGTLAVRRGERVAAGAAIGQAALVDDPRVSVELRRQGRPMDIARLAG